MSALPCLQRRHHSKRQLFAGWRLVCHRSALLQMALGRLAQRTLAVTFLSWRGIASLKHRRRSLLHVSARLPGWMNGLQSLCEHATACASSATVHFSAHVHAERSLRPTLYMWYIPTLCSTTAPVPDAWLLHTLLMMLSSIMAW